MRNLILSLAAVGLLAGTANIAMAQDATVMHKESADGEHSKTVIKSDEGKTVIKRHGTHMKKVHVDPNGDKTVVKKSVD